MLCPAPYIWSPSKSSCVSPCRRGFRADVAKGQCVTTKLRQPRYSLTPGSPMGIVLSHAKSVPATAPRRAR